MDEWNPLLPSAAPGPKPRGRSRVRLTGGILALLCALGLIGWFLTR